MKKLWLCLLLAVATHSDAAVLDWDAVGVDWTQTWTGNVTSISQTFTNVDGSGVNMTITMTRGANTAIGEVDDSGTKLIPDDDATITFNGETALRADINYTDLTNDSLTFNITFSRTVSNVSFQLWDIDLGNSGTSTYQDVIANFTGTPTLSEVGNGTDLIVSGSTFRGVATLNSTTNAGNENDTSGTGRGLVDYGSTSLTSVSFAYLSGNGSGSSVTFGTNPTLQRIALHDISFSPVPEPSTWAAAAALAVFAAARALRRRRAGISLPAPRRH